MIMDNISTHQSQEPYVAQVSMTPIECLAILDLLVATIRHHRDELHPRQLDEYFDVIDGLRGSLQVLFADLDL